MNNYVITYIKYIQYTYSIRVLAKPTKRVSDCAKFNSCIRLSPERIFVEGFINYRI